MDKAAIAKGFADLQKCNPSVHTIFIKKERGLKRIDNVLIPSRRVAVKIEGIIRKLSGRCSTLNTGNKRSNSPFECLRSQNLS